MPLKSSRRMSRHIRLLTRGQRFEDSSISQCVILLYKQRYQKENPMKAILIFTISMLSYGLSAQAGLCYQEALKFHSTKESVILCASVGDLCFEEAFKFSSLSSAAKTCRNVYSNSCYIENFKSLSLSATANVCRGVDEDCFVDAFRFRSATGAADECRLNQPPLCH